jgi:hypothetical protein
MLWALITPSPDDLTDLGEIEPLIVLINFIGVLAETTSPCAGIAVAQSEVTRINVRKRLRIPKLY